MAEYGYDAWNRLVKVVDAGTSSTVAEYGYDGRNFRIVTKTYASGVLSEVRHGYYNGDWQLLEERVEAAPLPNPQSLIPAAQFVWGLRYIDNLILRDRNADSNTSTGNLGKTGSGLEERLYAMQDANWNVVAIADTSGAVQERYVYTAYGTPSFLTAAFVPRSPNASGYAWETLFTGRQYDREVGMYHYRRRPYGLLIGRFLSRDPNFYDAGDMSLYRYVLGQCTRGLDPFGLSPFVNLLLGPHEGSGCDCPCDRVISQTEKETIIIRARQLKSGPESPIKKTYVGYGPRDPRYNMCEEQARQLIGAIEPRTYKCWKFALYNGKRPTLKFWHWGEVLLEIWNVVIVRPINGNSLPAFILDPFWGYDNSATSVEERSLEVFHQDFNVKNDYGWCPPKPNYFPTQQPYMY